MHEGGGNCVKYLKKGWNRKEERGDKKFKTNGEGGGRSYVKGWVPKKGGGGWNLLTNYDV